MSSFNPQSIVYDIIYGFVYANAKTNKTSIVIQLSLLLINH